MAHKRQAVHTLDTCDHPAEARYLDLDIGWLVCTRCALVLRENVPLDGGDGAMSKAAKGLPRSCIPDGELWMGRNTFEKTWSTASDEMQMETEADDDDSSWTPHDPLCATSFQHLMQRARAGWQCEAWTKIMLNGGRWSWTFPTP